MSRAVLAVFVAATVTSGAPWLQSRAAARQSPQQPVFRAGINLVQTDVTVLGPDGRPIHGLTMDEFELLEDGEPVPILGFAEVNIPDATDGPAWLRDSTADVRRALEGRVFVFLLDDAQVPYLMERGSRFVHPNDRIAAVKRITEQFINRLGPGDMAAVICVYDNRCDQDFTSDRERIRAAVGKFMPKSPMWGASPYKVSSNMAMSIARMLTGQVSRRRTIVYVSPRLPTRPAVWPPLNNQMSLDDIQVLATFKDAMRSGITVYGINPTSLLSLKDAPADDPEAPDPGRTRRFSTPARSLATETGGFIVSRPDQFADGVSQIFRETGSYYLLGYEPPPKRDTGYNMIGGLRSIEVRVSRAGAVVKAHRGYITAPEPKPSNNPPAASTSALAGVLPRVDLPLRVSVAPFPEPGQSDADVVITLGISQPAPDSRMLERFDVQVRAFTPHGDQRASVRVPVDAVLRPGRGGTSVTEIVTGMRLKPGIYEIRAAAYSERMDTSGSVFADVEIPDVKKAPLALSGVLLMSLPRPEFVLPAPLSPTLPTTPTTEREFTRTALVRAYLRLYQGGKKPVAPVDVRTTILDQAGAVAFTRAETLGADRFADGRSAEFRLDVPVGTLGAGLHRLRIAADGGGSPPVFRDVQFVIR